MFPVSRSIRENNQFKIFFGQNQELNNNSDLNHNTDPNDDTDLNHNSDPKHNFDPNQTLKFRGQQLRNYAPWRDGA